MSYLPDAYARRARIAPAVIVAMPLVVLTGATAFVHLPLAGVSALIAGAYLVLIEQLSRDAGRGIQDVLWASWGGSPTLRRFRYSGSASVADTDRLHRQVGDLVGWGLPTQAQEQADPAAADVAYNTATSAIQNQTRDKRFDLLHKENANYGFRRNLVGLRRWGIAAGLATVVGAVVIALVEGGPVSHRVGAAALPILYGIGSLIGFTILPQDWPRLPAEAYADRLVDSIQTLHIEQAGRS